MPWPLLPPYAGPSSTVCARRLRHVHHGVAAGGPAVSRLGLDVTLILQAGLMLAVPMILLACPPCCTVSRARAQVAWLDPDFRSRGRCFPLLQSGEHAAIDTGHGMLILYKR